MTDRYMEGIVTNSVLQPGSNGDRAIGAAKRSAGLLLATDGTPQSEAAVAFTYLLSLKDERCSRTHGKWCAHPSGVLSTGR